MAFWYGEQYRFALFEHNDGTGSACWFEVILFWPGDCGTSEIGGIGHVERNAGLTVLLRVAAQRVDGVSFRELCRAKTFHEHASDQCAMFFHSFEYRIER